MDGTVDGRNRAPVDMVNIPLFTGFYTSQVVVWDFFHQQYGYPFGDLQEAKDVESKLKEVILESNQRVRQQHVQDVV